MALATRTFEMDASPLFSAHQRRKFSFAFKLALLYFTLLYFTLLYFTLLYFTLLCFALLSFPFLYYALLCFALLYISLLYFILFTSKCLIFVTNHESALRCDV